MISEYLTDEFFYVLYFILATCTYTFVDRKLTNVYEGRYYLLHSINNAVITYCTYPAVIYSYTNLDTFNEYERSIAAPVLTAALHTYHIIEYKEKLTYYDYIHHGSMCMVALPLGVYVNSGALLDHSLFYITGVPGMIDYMMMFLVRNKKLNKMTQKKINTYINLWLRCPGCVSLSTLTTVVYVNSSNLIFDEIQSAMVIAIIFLVFWNGVYFMNLVVRDYAQQQIIAGRKLE